MNANSSFVYVAGGGPPIPTDFKTCAGRGSIQSSNKANNVA